MAKKFGRLVLFSALAGAAAAGTYYYLQKKQDDPLKDIDTDDFDDFDDDFDDEDEDITSESHMNKNRSYVSLDLDSAKEIIGEKVIETIDKTKEKIENFNVSEKLDKAKEIIEEMTQPVETVESEIKATPTQETQSEIQEESADEIQPDIKEEPVSVSATYSGEEEADSEEFFDDTDEEE